MNMCECLRMRVREGDVKVGMSDVRCEDVSMCEDVRLYIRMCE